ncbi:hypothetical protein [Mesorhizobium sp. SP-1A]|uniref:hypothetical protein n=1 Tax=Mesorhizobium sp. SP-1A TaxID=3077840 RepID=UPI0028F6CDF6|nr:hypothetical protein [Mesorhizobium sp. SP-1A]
MQRALREFKKATPERIEAAGQYRAEWLRNLAIRFLPAHGVKLIGDPSLVEFTIGRVTCDFSDAVKIAEDEAASRKRGRPANDLDTNMIYAAAVTLQADGLSIAEAARRAAKFLGAPATKDRVEKGLKAFLRWGGGVREAASRTGEDVERASYFVIWLLTTTRFELTRFAKEIAAEKAEAEARRKFGRHVSFIGATPRASLLPLTKETKQ